MNALLVADSENNEFTREGPGAFLKAAREERGWDVEYIANTLHLTNDVVVALENNAFDQLPSPVFVQGYLRKYARVIDQPCDPLLRAYDNARPREDRRQQNLRAGASKAEISSNHGVMRILSFLIFAAMAGLMFVWWQGYLQHTEPGLIQRALDRLSGQQSPLTTAPPDSGDGAGNLSPTLVESAEGEAGTEPVAEAVPFSYTREAESLTPQAVAEPEASAQASQAGGLSAPSTAEPPAAAVSEPALASGSAASTTPAVGEGSVSSGSPFEVNFIFKDASWVDVRDASGRLLIIGEVDAGSTKQLNQGQPPFSVVLGRASAVRLEVNGQEFDLNAHSSKNVARFQLDAGVLGLETRN